MEAMRSVTLTMVVALFALAIGIAGCGGGEEGSAYQRPVVRSLDSSWVPGQISMAELAAYQTISQPALEAAKARAQQRRRELALLEARRIAARKKAREDARRRYLEALRRAREKHRLALKRAAEARRRALERLRREKERIARLRREAEEKRKVLPGEECRDPRLRQRYHCSTGKTPLPPPKRR